MSTSAQLFLQPIMFAPIVHCDYSGGIAVTPRLLEAPIEILTITSDEITARLRIALGRSGNDFRLTSGLAKYHTAEQMLMQNESDIVLVSETVEGTSRSGFEILRQLQTSETDSMGVMLLETLTANSATEAFRSGARGVFYLDGPLKALHKCIRAVHRGQQWASNTDIQNIVGAIRREASAIRKFVPATSPEAVYSQRSFVASCGSPTDRL